MHLLLRALLLTALLFACAVSGVAGDAIRPNFLILFIDNVGYGDLSCYGNRDVKTPNIDKLAAEGVRCTDFYVGSPSCTPSRGAILTGRHPERNGLNFQLSAKQNTNGIGLPVSEKIIPQYLKPLGYATAAFGKWNLGFAPGARPTERGFDEFLGHASGNIHYYKHLYHGQNDLRRGTNVIDLRGQYSTDLFADAAIDFIRRKKEQPWFVYLPFNAAHFVSSVNVEPGEKIEWQVPAKYLAAYGCPPDEPDQKKRFRAVLTALDDAIGRVLQTVDETGLRARTFVLLISDNGAFMLKGRGLEVQSNAPLRDGGVTTYEGGVRVPAVFRWPGKLKPRTCHEILSTLDVLPTLVAAARGKPPSDGLLDGFNMLPALQGGSQSQHKTLAWVWNEGKDQHWQALRSADWKIVRRSEILPWELYDLRNDISESNDLSAKKPKIVERLTSEFDSWRKSTHSTRQ